MTERTRDDIREQRRLICQVPCRQCGAQKGVACRTPGGKAAANGPHGSRRADAAEAGLWVPGARSGAPA